MNFLKRLAGVILTAVMLTAVNTAFAAQPSYVLDKGEMNFIKIEPIDFALQMQLIHTWYRSSINQMWYAYFQADEDYKSKPLFVFLNGGPGCGTSMNLFAMNTAPYTLDRSKVKPGQLSARNEYSWTALGNLLYIDAPNTGFSYMIYDEKEEAKKHRHSFIDDTHTFKLKPFLFGDNYNAYIDAAQVLRCLFKFLEQHREIINNEIILVGESYSGVRVTTMLNLLLRYKKYGDGSLVYKDPGLAKMIDAHYEKLVDGKKGRHPSYLEQIKKQFKRQVLIQPQIVDTYQGEDEAQAFLAPNSLMDKLAKENPDKKSWREYIKAYKQQHDKNPSALDYLSYIGRDPYNCAKESTWTDENEYFSMQALQDYNELGTITGTVVGTVPGFKPENRKHAFRFALHKILPLCANEFLRRIKIQIPADVQSKLDLVPFLQKNEASMINPMGTLETKLGKLNDFDMYLVGTNPYIFGSFYLNGGGETIEGILWAMIDDKFGISPADSDRFGVLFLENLTCIDTFMTYAANDIIVYSPALASQFDKGRFQRMVKSVEYDKSWPNIDGAKSSKITFHYKKGGVKAFDHVPETRSVDWFYYADSGHSVSSTEPEKFRNDVQGWLNSNKK